MPCRGRPLVVDLRRLVDHQPRRPAHRPPGATGRSVEVGRPALDRAGTGSLRQRGHVVHLRRRVGHPVPRCVAVAAGDPLQKPRRLPLPRSDGGLGDYPLLSLRRPGGVTPRTPAPALRVARGLAGYANDPPWPGGRFGVGRVGQPAAMGSGSLTCAARRRAGCAGGASSNTR